MNQPFVLNVFQTLLSWKSVSGPRWASTHCARSGFKPCCHGSRSAASRPLTARYRPIERFKPCCHGSRSAARSSSRIWFRQRVSNLVVMEVGQRLPTPLDRPLGKKVSNLVVMEVGQRPFSGISPPTARAVSNLVVMEVGQRPEWLYCITWGGVRVSNLVVMEVGQRRRSPRRITPPASRFQTLLSWKSVSGLALR